MRSSCMTPPGAISNWQEAGCCPAPDLEMC
jgi:hypothetical protein